MHSNTMDAMREILHESDREGGLHHCITHSLRASLLS